MAYLGSHTRAVPSVLAVATRVTGIAERHVENATDMAPEHTELRAGRSVPEPSDLVQSARHDHVRRRREPSDGDASPMKEARRRDSGETS